MIFFSFQVKAKNEGILGEVSSDANRCSPGSVLYASFSNDSCISSSFDDSSGRILISIPLNVVAY